MDSIINKVYDNISSYIDNSCITECPSTGWPVELQATVDLEVSLLDKWFNKTGEVLTGNKLHKIYDNSISFMELRTGIDIDNGMILVTIKDGNILKLIQLPVTEIKNDLEKSETSIQIYQKSYAASWLIGCQKCTITFNLTPDGITISMTGNKQPLTVDIDYMEAFRFVANKTGCLKF